MYATLPTTQTTPTNNGKKHIMLTSLHQIGFESKEDPRIIIIDKTRTM
jgi:hypothetical protein